MKKIITLLFAAVLFSAPVHAQNLGDLGKALGNLVGKKVINSITNKVEKKAAEIGDNPIVKALEAQADSLDASGSVVGGDGSAADGSAAGGSAVGGSAVGGSVTGGGSSAAGGSAVGGGGSDAGSSAVGGGIGRVLSGFNALIENSKTAGMAPLRDFSEQNAARKERNLTLEYDDWD